MAKKKKPRTVAVGRNTVRSRSRPRPKPRGQTIFRPRPGSYDPDIDAQERAAERGFGYTTEDVDRGRERSLSDYLLGQGEVQRQYGENLSDLITQRTQGQQDYQTNLQSISRNFQRLGNAQAQTGRQRGLAGGFQQQAARKRAVNQALERAPVDLGFKRFMEGSQLAEKRLGEARDRDVGQLSLGYQRGDEDFGTTLQRAGRELEAFRLDSAAARQAQSGQPLVTLPAAKRRKNTQRQRMTQALKSTRIGGRPVSYAQWQRGDLARALLGGRY